MEKNVIKMSEICRKYEPKVIDPIRLDWMANCTILDVQVMMLKREGYSEEQIYEIVKPTCDRLVELLDEMKARESGEI